MACVVQLLSSSRGGAATHGLALASGLVRRGARVYVAMPYDGGNLRARHLRAAGIIPLRWDGGWVPLVRLLSPLRPTVLHAHGSRAAFWGALALAWPGLWGCRLLYSLHGFVTPFHPQPRRAVQLAIERLIAARAQAVVCDARAERQQALRFGLTTPDRAWTVLLGFDLQAWFDLGSVQRAQARLDLGLQSDDWFLLNICRLDRPRDFDTLLRAVQTMPARVKLGIVGGGALEPEIRQQIHEGALERRVSLHGLVPSTLPYYAAADGFVLTSWGWEGLPVTVIEAQAAGLPVVVTDAGGSAEAIVPGQSGLLVPRRDPVALSEAVCRLVANVEKAEAMGAAGRVHARASFGLDRMVDEIERLMRYNV